MAKLIIVVAIGVLGIFFWRWFKLEYASKGRPFAVKTLLIGTAVALLILAAIGRVHWVGAALASLLALARFSLPIALKSFPLFQQWRHQRQQTTEEKSSNDNISMTEALDILGLSKDPNNAPSYDEIVEAHRRLIQKLHPDRGGSEYLATRINLAKDILTKV